MPIGEIAHGTGVLAAAYVGTKLFGPALATMGDDINKLYVKGRDKIVEVATKKVDDPEDGKKVNLRAARDVVWNGAITEDEVCAEYFGGMLAAARSEDGRDDGVVHYVDTIKAMSTQQLELHYVIYKAWQALLLEEQSSINVGYGAEVESKRLFFFGRELSHRGLQYDRDLTVLRRQGLVHGFGCDYFFTGGVAIPYVEIAPTVFGVLLFAVAHNKLDTWRLFAKEVYESTTGIAGVRLSAASLEKLKEAAGLGNLAT